MCVEHETGIPSSGRETQEMSSPSVFLVMVGQILALALDEIKR